MSGVNRIGDLVLQRSEGRGLTLIARSFSEGSCGESALDQGRNSLLQGPEVGIVYAFAFQRDHGLK